MCRGIKRNRNWILFRSDDIWVFSNYVVLHE